MDQHRATFASRYAQPRQPWRKDSGPRLMECNLSVQTVAPGAVPPYPRDTEFAVIDIDRHQIAYFEWPAGMDTDRVERMVTGHFGVAAVRAFDKVWAV